MIISILDIALSSSEAQGLSLSLTACILAIVLLILMIYAPPRCLIRLLSKLFPQVLFAVDLPSDLRYVALTIDDFPNPRDLSISFEILDILRSYNARCTFFTIGSHIETHVESPRLRALFERLHADGHEVANHGWRDEKAVRLPLAELEKQIVDTQRLIDEYTSTASRWYRPGSGFFNRTMVQLCHRLGYRLALGSIYPHDPQIARPRLNSFFIERKLYPGAIVILHDRLATIDTLRRLLPRVQQRSFHIVTLTQLLNLRSNQ